MEKVFRLWWTDIANSQVSVYLFLLWIYFHEYIISLTNWRYRLFFLNCTLSEYLGDCDADSIAFLSYRIGQACLELQEYPKAKYYLQKADEIYKQVPGMSHPFYQKEFLSVLHRIQCNVWLFVIKKISHFLIFENIVVLYR